MTAPPPRKGHIYFFFSIIGSIPGKSGAGCEELNSIGSRSPMPLPEESHSFSDLSASMEKIRNFQIHIFLILLLDSLCMLSVVY